MLKINEVDELVFIIDYRKKRNFNLFKKLLSKIFRNRIKKLTWPNGQNFLMSLDIVFKNYYSNNVLDSRIQKIYVFKNRYHEWFYNSNEIALNEKDILDFLRNEKNTTSCYVFSIDNIVKVFKFKNSNFKKINFSLEEKQKKILKYKKLSI